MTNMKRNILGLVSLLSCTTSLTYALPFERCPGEAFLIQDRVAQLYSVDLATGFSKPLSTPGWTSAKMNALAFNLSDSYLYAYNYETGSISRLGADNSVAELNANMQGLSFLSVIYRPRKTPTTSTEAVAITVCIGSRWTVSAMTIYRCRKLFPARH